MFIPFFTICNVYVLTCVIHYILNAMFVNFVCTRELWCFQIFKYNLNLKLIVILKRLFEILVQFMFILKTKLTSHLQSQHFFSVYRFYFKLNIIIQISTTNMYVSWDSFEDVEEFQTIPHTSGIQNYELGIGACLISLRCNVNWQSARNYFHQHEQWKCHLSISIVVVLLARYLIFWLIIYIWNLMSRVWWALILCLVHIN